MRIACDFRHVFEGVCGEIVDTSLQLTEVICLNENTDMYRVKVRNSEAKRSNLLNGVKPKDSSRCKQVYISRDFNFRQRQEQRTARAERALQPARGIVYPNFAGANVEPINSSPRAPSTPPPQDTADGSHVVDTSSASPGAVGSPTALTPNL